MKYMLIIAGILLLGLFLRLINLSGSLWLDEAAQALESARPLTQQLNIVGDFQPPLYHVLLHFWMIGGRSEWYIRLVSLIPALISIWLTIRIGEKLFSRNAGLLAGLFLATSQFHLFYSQELRPYSLAAMFGLVFMDAYIDIVILHKDRWVQFILAGIAGLYTMYLYPLLLVMTLVMTLLWYKPMLKKIIKAYGLLVIAFLPWMPFFLGQLSAGTGLAGSSTVWSSIVSPPLPKMLPLVFAKFFYGRIPFDINVRGIALMTLAAGLCLLAIITIWRLKNARILLLWLIVPVLFAFLISIKIPILDPKRVLFCLPALFLLLAAGVGKGIRAKIMTVTIVFINLYGIYQYTVNPEAQREPWRHAVQAIQQSATANSMAVFAFPEPFAPWQWYAAPQIKTAAIGDPTNQQEKILQLIETSHRVDHYFVFDYLMDMTDPQRLIINELSRHNIKEINSIQYPGIGKIRIFQSANPSYALLFP